MDNEKTEFDIVTADDLTETFEYFDDVFGQRVKTRIIKSDKLKSQIKFNYIYLPAYNTSGVLGGYALQDVLREVTIDA